MAKRRYYLDTRVVTAFFFAAMPFVAFGSFVVVSMAKTRLQDSVGVSLEQRAVQTKLALEQYVGEQVAQLRLLALDPAIMKALEAPPRAVDDAQMREIEQAWAGGKDARLAAEILESPIATRLRALSTVRPAIKQVELIDTQGRVLAASTRGGRLFQAERAWFKDMAGQQGEAVLHVGDMFRPAPSASPLLELAFPVETADGTWLGALRALLDADDLYSVLAPVRVGRTGHAVLVRATDGMVLASDESERMLKTPLPGFDSLKNALEGFPIATEGQAIFGKTRVRRGYWTIPAVKGRDSAGREVTIEPARLVGFSPVDQIPDVQWLISVEQDLQEALEPIDSVTRYLWIHFAGVFATVILLALYFSFKLEKPVMEEGFHLHEQHLPAGTKQDDES
jgi:Cache domain